MSLAHRGMSSTEWAMSFITPEETRFNRARYDPWFLRAFNCWAFNMRRDNEIAVTPAFACEAEYCLDRADAPSGILL